MSQERPQRGPKRLFIETYGCQMNVYDSERMRDVLAPLGYAPVDKPDDADLVVLNTCHIREKATEKVYSEIGRLRAHKERRAAEGKSTSIVTTNLLNVVVLTATLSETLSRSTKPRITRHRDSAG